MKLENMMMMVGWFVNNVDKSTNIRLSKSCMPHLRANSTLTFIDQVSPLHEMWSLADGDTPLGWTFFFLNFLFYYNFFEKSMFMPDLDLQYISKFCASLHDLNLKGCISVTDVGISNITCNCMKLHSIVVCDTTFGKNSVLALCSGISSNYGNSSADDWGWNCNSLISNLQKLHIGGCKSECYSYFLHVILCVKNSVRMEI